MFLKIYLLANFCLFLFIFNSNLNSYETINKVLAIVGKQSISQVDFENGEERYLKLEKFMPNVNTKLSLKTRVLDFLITRAIIDITADEETIQVNDKRVETEIQRRMDMMGITDKAQFEKIISAQTNLPFDLWLSELPYQIKKGQLMQIRVNTQFPSDKEVEDWYNANKAKVGFELKYREIAIVPMDNSINEEKRIYSEISSIKKEIKQDPSAFNLIASGPRNLSRLKGGNSNWVPAYEVFQSSKTIAAMLSTLEANATSEIFRDEKKRYLIVKMEGKRATPLEQVKRGIQNLLHREKEEGAFDNWVKQRRKEVHITIFDKDYLLENKLEDPVESIQLE